MVAAGDGKSSCDAIRGALEGGQDEMEKWRGDARLVRETASASWEGGARERELAYHAN